MPQSWAERAKAEIDALGDTPTADEARAVSGEYEPTDFGAALVEKIGEGGGGGGGESLVTESGYYSGDPVTIENGGYGHLVWNVYDDGDEVLDTTDTEHPVVLKAGLFIINLQVNVLALASTGSMQGELLLDYTGDAVELNGSAARGGSAFKPILAMGGSWKLDAGMSILMSVYNNDGASSQQFLLKNATVSRIGPA
jgi:hypothetical protein